MNANNVYFTAAQHAVALGITSTACLKDLRRLARYESAEHIRKVIDGWAVGSVSGQPDKPLRKAIRWRVEVVKGGVWKRL